MGVFYFLADINKDINQPINVQLNKKVPKRIRALFNFEHSLAAQTYNGAIITQYNKQIAIMYFTTNKMFTPIIILFYIPYFALEPNSSSIRIN